MPVRPPLHRPSGQRTKREANRDYDKKRTTEQAWRRWYWTSAWRKIAKAQLTQHPLCAECEKKGRVVAATLCDHVEPHRGDPGLFWHGERQSLCVTCHSSAKQREEAVGVG